MSRTPSPPSARKKPHCHACGQPMAGHKRPDGLPLCPVKEESPTPRSSYASPPPSTRGPGPSYSSLFSGSLSSLASPPATPPRRRTPEATHAPKLITSSPKHEPSCEIPEKGAWHRRNPNWVDPPTMIPRPATPTGSYVSTVLVDDDGKTIRGSDHHRKGNDDEDDCLSVSESFIGNVAKTLKGRHVVSMFATKRAGLARTQQLAMKQGVHAALVRLPNENGTKKKGVQKAGSWWMVLGRDSAAVGRVVNEASQRRMPGSMGDSAVMYEGPRLTTFLQLILAGLIGGIVTVGGLSYL